MGSNLKLGDFLVVSSFSAPILILIIELQLTLGKQLYINVTNEKGQYPGQYLVNHCLRPVASKTRDAKFYELLFRFLKYSVNHDHGDPMRGKVIIVVFVYILLLQCRYVENPTCIPSILTSTIYCMIMPGSSCCFL